MPEPEARLDATLLPPDGRQSPTALVVRRGARRLLARLGYATLPEVALPNRRRADLLGVSGKGEAIIVEIKSSLADFRADRKWREYRRFCDQFYFAVPLALESAMLPPEAGLIIADAHGAHVARDCAREPMTSAARKAILVRFGQSGAARLHALEDPGWRAGEY